MALSLAVAIGIWWIANTVSHQFIHRPFFRHAWANACAGRSLTLALGVPQSLWRERHLAHHAGAIFRLRWSAALAVDVVLAVGVWTGLALGAPSFLWHTYAPGFAIAMLLCALHGHYEHAGGTTSHYGWIYNLLCLNDGYHVEHHRHPGVHWTRLPELRDPSSRASVWPAPLRWIDALRMSALAALERLVIASPRLQRFVVRTHASAFAALAPALCDARRIAIVGGGLFPRTALVLKELLPDASITIIDASRENLERARRFLGDTVTLRQEHVTIRRACDAPDGASPARPGQGDRLVPGWSDSATQARLWEACDVVIFPLSFDGDRDAIYAYPPAPLVVVHDWIWRRRGESAVVSILLLKRLNLIRQSEATLGNAERAEHAEKTFALRTLQTPPIRPTRLAQPARPAASHL